MSNDHWKKFEPDRRLVKEFDNWLVVQRARQVTLGSCVLLLKRPVSGLGEAEPSELAELASVAAWFEIRTRALYEAERFNYVAAMMKDPYLHFHAFPRYSAARQAYGHTWEDAAWPKVASFEQVSVEADVTDQMVADLRRSGSESSS